jgi:L-lactate dehydrogenase complex protein LldG
VTPRDEVLARIRAALGPAPQVPDIPRDYRLRGQHPPGSASLFDLLTDRLLDYRAGVHRRTEREVPAAIAGLLASRAATRAVVPPGLPCDWVPEGIVDDGSLTADDLDHLDVVVTGCAVAIAETGTLILDGSPDQGRRILTLVPDLHVCVVRAGQVVETVPEGLARLDPVRPLTMISGPSATSDIELDRVEGVHGPRTLEIILVAAPAPP